MDSNVILKPAINRRWVYILIYPLGTLYASDLGHFAVLQLVVLVNENIIDFIFKGNK